MLLLPPLDVPKVVNEGPDERLIDDEAYSFWG